MHKPNGKGWSGGEELALQTNHRSESSGVLVSPHSRMTVIFSDYSDLGAGQIP